MALPIKSNGYRNTLDCGTATGRDGSALGILRAGSGLAG